MSSLFPSNLIDQSSCRILTTHAKARPILHDDWSFRLGENGPDRALKHLPAMLIKATANSGPLKGANLKLDYFNVYIIAQSTFCTLAKRNHRKILIMELMLIMQYLMCQSVAFFCDEVELLLLLRSSERKGRVSFCIHPI